MNFFFGRKGNKGGGLPPNATFRLTEAGREKLQNFSGDPKSRILVALETEGTSDVEELSKQSGMSKGEIEKHIPVLIKGNYIQFVGSLGSDLDGD